MCLLLGIRYSAKYFRPTDISLQPLLKPSPVQTNEDPLHNIDNFFVVKMVNNYTFLASFTGLCFKWVAIYVGLSLQCLCFNKPASPALGHELRPLDIVYYQP